jgi:ribonuclease BN (tRNA processing enzyme)
VRLRVLGCSGGELPRHKTTCFLLDGRVAVDAGALTSSLPLARLLEVDDVVLTHSHFDHVKDVPLLADLVAGLRRGPVRVHASPQCAQTLRRHVFNGRLWPDFTRIPDRRRPAVELREFDPARPFRAGHLSFRPVPVDHPVESVGFVVSDGAAEVAISGDTGPTSAFWRRVNAARRLRALLVEVSFPDALQDLADASGHLTPATLATELAKVRRVGVPVLLYHLKPVHAAEVRREVAALGLPGLRILSVGDEFTFSR